MNVAIIDTDTGRTLWTINDCANHCGVTTSTWRSYSRTGGKMNLPQPVAHLNKRTALWDAEEVQAWHTARPGSPVPGAPVGKGAD